jgi:hypothetical protein
LATSLIHSKIIAQAAKETLSPLGVFQKGRSRTWIDDRGWWIVVVEFQPSSWSRGSYLNVGAMWLWHEKDYFSFDFGSRIARFVRYSDERQFMPEAMKLATQAREETLLFPTPLATYPSGQGNIAIRGLSWPQRLLWAMLGSLHNRDRSSRV